MDICSIGSILNLKCGSAKDKVFSKIDIDDLPIGQAELLRIRSRIESFSDVVDVCKKHKLQFIDSFSNANMYRCVDPFKMHTKLVKTNLHEVTLPEFHSNMFSSRDVLPGHRVCRKCCQKAKDTITPDTDGPTTDVPADIEMMTEENEISVETAHEIANKSLEFLDCSPLKNVKTDRALQAGKRKISKVTGAFSKVVAIALDEPALVESSQSKDCSNCSRLVELIKEKLTITEDRNKIIQLLTIVPCDFSISKVAEVFNVSTYTATQAHNLRLKKGILSIPERKKRIGIPQETKETYCIL